jgi:hypothetical protein
MRRGFAALKAKRESPEAIAEAEAYERARAAFEARLSAIERAKADCGLGAAQSALDAAWDAQSQSEVAVFETVPQTKAGALAVLRFAADFLDALGINDTEVNGLLTDRIRDAASLLETGAV